MKKILLSITTLLLAFCITTRVEAKSYSVLLNGANTFEEEITITIQINNQKEMSSYCNGICGLMANLKYDNSKLELIKVTELNDFEITYNQNDGTFIIERDTGAPNGTNVGTLKFKRKSLNNQESTTITLDNIVGTDGENDITTQKISKTIKYVKVTTNNNQSTESTNNNSTNKEEIKKKSNNNYLSSLTIDQIKFDFNKEKLIYDIVVKYNVDKVYISAKQEDNTAKIDGLGEHKLDVGKNSIKIVVKAEDETEREYVININREEELKENNNITNSITEEKTNNKNYTIYIVSIIVVILIIGSILIFKRKNKF